MTKYHRHITRVGFEPTTLAILKQCLVYKTSIQNELNKKLRDDLSHLSLPTFICVSELSYSRELKHYSSDSRSKFVFTVIKDGVHVQPIIIIQLKIAPERCTCRARQARESTGPGLRSLALGLSSSISCLLM